MAGLNTLQCANNAANTGIDACTFDFKKIVGVILTPKGYVIPAAALASDTALVTQLQNDAENSSKSLRIYPIWNMEEITDSSEKTVIQSTTYGNRHPVRDGYMDWAFQFFVGGLSLLTKLQQFNASPSGKDFLFVDENNSILGTAGVDSTGKACIMAIPSDGGFFRALPWLPNTGQKLSTYMTQISFAPQWINQYVTFTTCAQNLPTSVVGLETVILSNPSANVTSGSFNIVALTQDSGTNMYNEYSTQLSVGTLWTAYNTQTGQTIPVTSVTPGAAVGGADGSGNQIGGFVVALNTTSPNYPTTSGQKVTIGWVSPSALATGNVVGFEATTVAIVKN